MTAAANLGNDNHNRHRDSHRHDGYPLTGDAGMSTMNTDNVTDSTTSTARSMLHRLAGVFTALSLAFAPSAVQADVTYVHTDHLGNPVAYSNGRGELIAREFYTPYGERLMMPGGHDEPDFTGHVRDASTGLVYMQARYYDPEIGRFLSVDPVTFSPDKPDYFNRYWYAGGNPIKNVDPDGRCFGPVVVACIANAKIIADTVFVVSTAILATVLIEDAVNHTMNNESSSATGASTAPTEVTSNDESGWIYGPENDPKVNADGSTNGKTWVSPDDYGTQEEAQDKLDTFKPAEGRRPVNIPEGTEVQRGTTPGGEGPYQGSGGGNEILTQDGLPSGSVGDWEPLPRG